MYEIVAAAEMKVMDSYEEAMLVLVKRGEQYGAIARNEDLDVQSEVYIAEASADVYHAAKQWFSEAQDGFVDVNNVDPQGESVRELWAEVERDVERAFHLDAKQQKGL